MWKNNLKIALRNLKKQAGFSLINVFGLALGMACCFLITLYVLHESGYDKFHTNIDRLYRVNYRINFASELNHARIPPPAGGQMKDFFPEIEVAARMYPRDLSVSIPETDKQFELQHVYFSDSSISDVFDFEYLRGNAKTALRNPFSVILTKKTALKLFGSTDVMGKSLQLAAAKDFIVTAVIKDWPDQAHLDLNMLVYYQNMVDVEPLAAQERMQQVMETNWLATHSYAYVLLKEDQNPESVNAKFPGFVQQFGLERFRDKQELYLFPVKDIHLHSSIHGEAKPVANINFLYLFIIIGIITLLIACINFVNLATSSSIRRSKEVGVRKVLGASKASLVKQFLGESLMLSFFAFLLSLVFAKLALPHLNELTGLDITFQLTENIPLGLAFVGTFIVVGLLSGSYPAFYVSRLQASTAIKGGKSNPKSKGLIIQNILIGFQFLAAISIISGALIIYLQLDYLRSQPLGFEKELVLSVPIHSQSNINAVFRPDDAQIRQRMNTLDESLTKHPNIKAVTQCAQLPGLSAIERAVWTDKVPQEDQFFAPIMVVDYDFIDNFEMEVIAGRNFDVSYGTDHTSSFIINETAIRELKWESPVEALGERLVVEGKEGKIVGIVKDIHFQSLQNEIQSMVMEVRPGAFAYFAIQLENGDLPETLAFIEKEWATFFPEKAFEYHFLDEELNELYQSEERLGSIIGYFASLAIFISFFGLFGLAALLTQQRFKEIGIRKILGASLTHIMHIMSKDFVKLIALSMLAAGPLCWYFTQKWMSDFAYHIDFPWWVLVASGLAVIVLAFLTVSSIALRAALRNPVEVLRDE